MTNFFALTNCLNLIDIHRIANACYIVAKFICFYKISFLGWFQNYCFVQLVQTDNYVPFIVAEKTETIYEDIFYFVFGISELRDYIFGI